MRQSILILLIPIYFSFFSSAKASYRCEDLFTVRSSTSLDSSFQPDETDALITYLGTLLEHRIINEVELTRFVDALEKGEIINPISEEQASTSSAALVHHNKIQEFIDSIQLDPRKLLNFSREVINEKALVETKRKESQAATKTYGYRMTFYKIPKGIFKMGDDRLQMEGEDLKRNINIMQPFEVTSTPITQSQWVEMMGENPSFFKKGEHTIIVPLRGKLIQMQPDNPVEMITWWSILVFANRLSEKNGLKPAYDLSGITWKQGTSAEAGTLQAKSGEIKINVSGVVHHPYEGDVYYQTEGYRLPTEAEQEYILRAAGTANGKYYFGDNNKELKDHAWYYENSNHTTRPVAGLKPLVIDNENIYDLHGNVWEWSWGQFSKTSRQGKDDSIIHPKVGATGVIRGGCFSGDHTTLHTASRTELRHEDRSKGIGFRLVRTLHHSSETSQKEVSL